MMTRICAHLTTLLGYEVYTDDLDVVRSDCPDGKTIGHLRITQPNVVTFRQFNADESDYLPAITFTV